MKIKINDNLYLHHFDQSFLDEVLNLGLSIYGQDEATTKETLLHISKLPFGSEGYYFVTIMLSDEFIGYLCFYEENKDLLNVGDIVIKNEFRKRKIAQKCISSLIELIEKMEKYKKITLNVRENNLSAIKCYENLYFKHVEVISQYYLDKENAIKMERDLFSASQSSSPHHYQDMFPLC